MFYRLKEKFDVKGYRWKRWFPEGVELIIGLQNDFQFGPSIMVGLGYLHRIIQGCFIQSSSSFRKGDALKMLESLRGKDILKGFRGSKLIDLDMLSEAIVNIGTLGVDMAGKYESIDFNPVVVYPDSYYVVDAKIILKEKSSDNAISIANPDSSYMDLFFNAKSVALIGASPEPGKIGNSVMESLVKHDYKGKVYPINAKGYSEIMGVKSFTKTSWM